MLTLGIVPVGTTEWYGEHPGAIFPWAKEALGDAPLPEVLPFDDGIQYEKVAAPRPHLVLAIYSGLTEKATTLSKIAPTVAQPSGQVYVYGPQAHARACWPTSGSRCGQLSPEKVELLNVGGLVGSPTPMRPPGSARTASTGGSTCASRAATPSSTRTAPSTRRRP